MPLRCWEHSSPTRGKMQRLAASGDDRSLMKREAHSIKSSAATFGFTALSELARQIEVAAATMMSSDNRRELHP